MTDSKITADSNGTADGAPVGIDINIAGDILIANPTTRASATQGTIETSTQLARNLGTGGKAGDVIVSAGGNLQLGDGAAISAFTSGKGQAGKAG